MSRVRIIDGVIHELEHLRSDVGMAQMNQRSEILERVDPPIAAIVQGVKELKEALQPDTRRVRYLQGPERAASLIAALEAGAKACGAGLYASDSLHGLVVDHAPAQDKIWWHLQLPGLIVGMVRSEPEIRRTLADRRVIVWEGKRVALVPGDELWRIVHLDWYTSHGDIRRHVTDRWAGGRRCRFCRIWENERANELHRLELGKRSAAAVVNGIVAVAGGVLIHDECRAQWARWVEIASRYDSQDDAELADAAAHVKPRGALAAPPSIFLEQPISKAGGPSR